VKRILIFGVLLVLGCFLAWAPSSANNGKVEQDIIRLSIVITPEQSGLIDTLVEDFHRKTGLRVEVTSTNDVFQRAREEKADIVLSHYGKKDLENFVLEGYGTWPRMVFSNQAAVIGPKNDPAEIKGLSNAALALKRIARSGSPFIVNSIEGIRYLENILWESAGNPAKGSWYHDPGINKEEAARLAEAQGGYFLWGAYPFLRYKANMGSSLEILVSSDPVLQRVMAATLVNPNKIQSVNASGAESFLEYLLKPETQAKIAAFRSSGTDLQLWWPAGRDN